VHCLPRRGTVPPDADIAATAAAIGQGWAKPFRLLGTEGVGTVPTGRANADQAVEARQIGDFGAQFMYDWLRSVDRRTLEQNHADKP
jgi:hypothetical protein